MGHVVQASAYAAAAMIAYLTIEILRGEKEFRWLAAPMGMCCLLMAALILHVDFGF